MNLAVSFLANGEGLGLRIGVGLGNAADVGFAEVLDFLADDDATKVIGLHLEGVDDGRALFEAIARTSERKAGGGAEGGAFRGERVRAVAHRTAASATSVSAAPRSLRRARCSSTTSGSWSTRCGRSSSRRVASVLVAWCRGGDRAGRAGPAHHRRAPQPRRLGAAARRCDSEGAAAPAASAHLAVEPRGHGPSDRDLRAGARARRRRRRRGRDGDVRAQGERRGRTRRSRSGRPVSRASCRSCSARAAPARCSTCPSAC